MLLSNMFIDNSFTVQYMQLMLFAKNRVSLDGYGENHHIVPKSLGGLNNPENIVWLTAKEHFIAHQLLVDMVSGANRAKMVYAFWQMANVKNASQGKRYIPTADEYQELKELRMQCKSSASTRELISASRKGKREMYNPNLKKSKIVSDYQINDFLSLGYELRGKPVSTERKQKISDTNNRKNITPPDKWLAWNKGLTKDTSSVLKHASDTMKGRIPWNKGIKMQTPPHNKGKTLEELYGTSKATEIRQAMSNNMLGKVLGKPRKVMIGGKLYDSIISARKALGLTRLMVLRLNELKNDN